MEYLVEGANIVNCLAMIDGFAEEVLIDVGNGLTIGVGTARVGEQSREASGGGGRERDTYTGLNDRVTTNAVAPVGSQFHAVQRVGNGFDELLRTVVR